MNLNQIIQMPYLTDALKEEVLALESLVKAAQPIQMKLELDYKEGVRNVEGGALEAKEMCREWLFQSDQKVVAYLGVAQFGGHLAEVSGMVHPEYREKGIFKRLFELAMAELRRYGNYQALLLCDEKSTSGQAFLEKQRVEKHHSEYEMYLNEATYQSAKTDTQGVCLIKATNDDKDEVARQNAIYFGLPVNEVPELLPDEEAARGMTIYLAVYQGEIVGKVHIENHSAVCGIFGLGVYPAFRARGLGRAILSLAVNQMLKDKAPIIMLQVEANNKTALTLYESCGFEVQSTMTYGLYNL